MKVIKIWPAKRVILNLNYCGKIFEMVCKFPGWIIDSNAPNERWTLKLILSNLLFNNCKIIE